VRSAQTELIRLGCLTGKADGTPSDPTKTALGRYMSIGGQPTDNISVTVALVTELTKHTTRVCPIECKADETLKGETCVANERPAAAPATVSKSDDQDNAKSRRKQADRQQEAPRHPKQAAEAPRARQQAQARPSIVSGGGGGGGGGGHAIIGVGF
jgi:hypothetical protein